MTEAHGKRVGWVELYFDLVFVFAVGQVAHGMVAEPQWSRIGAALGLFVTLWWTWIGFAVLYNRRGDDSRPADRLLVLAGTIPCAVAATQTHHVFEGHPTAYALALAAVRLVLAVAHLRPVPGAPDQRRIGWGYAASTVLFAVSAVLPSPWLFVLWAFALLQEAGFLLLGDRRIRRAEPRDRHDQAARWRVLLAPPADADRAVDAAHLSERFGLFMIVLLGELVITVGAAAVQRPSDDTGYWSALVGGLVLAGALWWMYFSSAAEIYERMLGMSGGNPALAYALYAVGHLLPAFALLLVAAGLDLSLQESPPRSAVWFVTGGLVTYLIGTRAYGRWPRPWFLRLLQLLFFAATACLALLGWILSAPVVVLIVAAWAGAAAAFVGAIRHRALEQLGDDPADFLRALPSDRR